MGRVEPIQVIGAIRCSQGLLGPCVCALLRAAYGLLLVALTKRPPGAPPAHAEGLALPFFMLFAGLTFAARSERIRLCEGIVVSPSVRLSKERGVALDGVDPLPEATIVQLLRTVNRNSFYTKSVHLVEDFTANHKPEHATS